MTERITLGSLMEASRLLDEIKGPGCAVVRPLRGKQCVVVGEDGIKDVRVYNATTAPAKEVDLSKKNQRRWNKFYREIRNDF